MRYAGPTHVEGGFLVRDHPGSPAAARPRPDEHLHIWIDDARPLGRGRDQGPPGAVLARFAQDGASGDWRAWDGEGNELEVRPGRDGLLEIVHHPEPEDQPGAGDEYDPDDRSDRMNLQTPAGAEGQFPGQDARRRVARKRAGDSLVNRSDQPAALREWQRQLDAHYGRR